MKTLRLLTPALVLFSGALLGPAASAHACGTERWPVKTLTDSDAGSVRFTPKSSSVKALRALKRPSSLKRRTAPVETTTYRIKTQLVSFKFEEDEDIHLVVAQPDNRKKTMIVEFPSSGCITKARSSPRKKLNSARKALTNACDTPSKSDFRALHGSATITGVGFFDFKHHQRGVAPNAIELHPVVGFKASNCM
jgi:hypothetical protein